MPWAELCIFSGIMGLAQMSPGPDMLLLTRTSLAHGKTAGWAMAFGVACGLTVHAVLVLTGVSWLIQSHERWWNLALWVAATYLIWLGGGLLLAAWRNQTESSESMEMAPRRVGDMTLAAAWRRGLLCNLLNPKAAIVIAVMTLPFLKLSDSLWWTTALFGVLVVQALVLWCLWVKILQITFFRQCYDRWSRFLDLMFGAGLFILAVAILF